MTYAEAREHILFETMNGDGIIVFAHCHGIPDPQRVRQLLLALKTVFEWHIGKENIERVLAFALSELAEGIMNESRAYGAAIKASSRRAKEFSEWEAFDIAGAAKAILAGDWPDTWMSFGPASKLITTGSETP